jgi:hypothetical protein
VSKNPPKMSKDPHFMGQVANASRRKASVEQLSDPPSPCTSVDADTSKTNDTWVALKETEHDLLGRNHEDEGSIIDGTSLDETEVNAAIHNFVRHTGRSQRLMNEAHEGPADQRSIAEHPQRHGRCRRSVTLLLGRRRSAAAYESSTPRPSVSPTRQSITVMEQNVPASEMESEPTESARRRTRRSLVFVEEVILGGDDAAASGNTISSA